MFKPIGLSAVLVLSSLLFCLASYADEPSTVFVVQNNSFESADGNGAPEKWNCSSKYFSVDSSDARSGNSCLKWSGDGSEYRLCTQTLDIPSGAAVDFSVWIKTKDLKDGKATVCLEWNRKDGTWYAGSYASGIGGTDNEWRQVKSRAFIPKDAVNPHIACYVTQGGSGVAWFDDVTVVKTVFPLFSAITTNRYRAQSDGGKVDVYVGYTAPSDDFDCASLSPKLAVVNSDNEEVASASLEEVVSQTDRYYRFSSFDSTALASGDYTLSCSAVNPESKKTETIATRFSKLDKFPERTSYIDEHLRLIHNGKPFFPDLPHRPVLMHYWLPEAKINDPDRKDVVDYRLWADMGLIHPMPGNVLDTDQMSADILDILRQYDTQILSFDPFKAYHGIIQNLQKAGLGDILDEFSQGIKNMSEPTKKVESLVIGAEVDLMGDPVLRWMFGNVVLYQDPNDNIKVHKGKSRNKVDGVVALINAVGGWMSKTAEEQGRIIYNDHSLRTIRI